MGRDFWKNFGVLIGAVLLSATASALIVWGMVAWAGLSHGDSARLFQAVGAVTVIFVGGVFAYWRLQIFRTFQPHLTISHEVSHRFIGDSYVHISVTANLYNSSRVKIELREGKFRLQQIKPASDEEIERTFAEVFIDAEYEEFQWPILNEVPRFWNERVLIIEPGATYRETQEFIVSSDIESVMIYTYFYNLDFLQSSQVTQGWEETTVYDIVSWD